MLWRLALAWLLAEHLQLPRTWADPQMWGAIGRAVGLGKGVRQMWLPGMSWDSSWTLAAKRRKRLRRDSEEVVRDRSRVAFAGYQAACACIECCQRLWMGPASCVTGLRLEQSVVSKAVAAVHAPL